MNKKQFEKLKRELRDNIDFLNNNIQREKAVLEAKHQGYRDGIFTALKAFEELIKE